MFYLLHYTKRFCPRNIISLFLFCLFLFPSLAFPQNIHANSKTIAITQIVSHPSLDKVHQGIIDELANNGYQDKKTAKIVFENAQGSPVIAAQIAQQFVNLQPDVIVAIATPSAQAAANSTKKTNIPLVFASVSDPIEAKLVDNLEHPGKNITGTRNISPLSKQISLVKEIIPKVKTIGIVLNYSEVNSVQLLNKVKEVAKDYQIEVKVAAATSSAEVQSAAISLIGKVDVLLLLQDNTVASALPALLKITNKQGLPVFSTYNDAVQSGALAGLAFDEYLIGRQTGKIIVDILSGKKPGEIPVTDPTDIQLAINLDTAQKIKIKFSDELLKEAKQQYSTKRI